MTLIAHMADIHLGYRQYQLLDREIDVYEAFTEAIDKILEEHAKAVLISGDTFHTSLPPIRALWHAKDCFGKLGERGIKSFYVLGDHDAPRRIGQWSPLDLFRDQHLIHVNETSVRVELDGRNFLIAGIDKPPVTATDKAREVLDHLSKTSYNDGSTRILVAHVPQRFGRDELSLDDLPTNFAYYALGHEHSRTIIKRGAGVAAYPGSIEIFSRDEAVSWKREGKGFYLVDFSGSEPSIQRVDLDSIRPQEVIDVSLSEPHDRISELIVNRNKRPILHLNIRDHTVDQRKVLELVEELRRMGCLDVRYRTVPPAGSMDSASITHFDFSRFKVEELIKSCVSEMGLSEDEANLALQLYKVFHTSGEEGLRELMRRRIEVEGA
ncbi:MAG: exonuclease SbcCD subunit D [Aigarchaeota archaeon]|nr:exonuclease SbcCD subunit D [Aigarchaeota archaeon]MDW8092472.1 exonuclease SbcCD subunit D [Nitrososphaerota archaeon]